MKNVLKGIGRENLDIVSKILIKNNIYNEIVGSVQNDFFEIIGELKISTTDLYKNNNTWYNNF